jgi:hypothetical protein
MRASPVAGVYDEAVDRESASEILQKRAADQSDAGTAASDSSAAKKTVGGSVSRADGFWTTFGKQVIRSVVPAATRMLEQSIKRGIKR